MTVQAKDAIETGKVDKDLRLVYGGVHFTFRLEDGLKYGDIVVICGREEKFLEICRGRALHKINGIAYKEDDKIISTKPREFIQDLDIVPFPAYARASTRLSGETSEIVGLHIGPLGYCLKDLELTRSEI